MREIKRRIARHLMEMHGVEQINRKKYQDRRGTQNKAKPDGGRKVSFFALHWREYLDPESGYRKDLERQLKRQAALQSRAGGKPVQAPWPVPRR